MSDSTTRTRPQPGDLTIDTTKITWTWPVLIVFARLVFAVLAQSLVAGGYALSGHPDPYRAAAPWWGVYGSLIDLGCLLLLAWLVRKEGLRLRDLIGFEREPLGRDLLAGAGMFVLFMAVAVGGAMLASLAVYGTHELPSPFGALPLWAALYSVFVWPLLWAVAEETTYLGYALPRLEALSGRGWLAVSIMTFGVAAQHIALPLGDPQWMLYRFVSFVPLGIMLGLLFLRTRRLMPFIIAHWAADALGSATSTLLPMLQQ